MMRIHPHTHLIHSLAKISTQFGKEFINEKQQLLLQCRSIAYKNVKLIKLHHNTLLFLMAYPEDWNIYNLALAEMNSLCRATQKLSADKKQQLTNSGIALNETQGTFSFEIMKWLIQTRPEETTIHSFDETGVHPKELLKHGLNEMEFELTGDESLSKMKWLEQACGSKNKKTILKFLIDRVAEMPLETALKEQLFASLKLYISLQPRQASFSRSFGSINIEKQYLHKDGLLKKFDEPALINQKLPAEKKLDQKAKEAILDTARTSLLLLNRETDPISYGNSNGIKVFELEHGLSIALFSIGEHTRLPLESYIGFMMFKNGHPMAYGGAWLFGKRSLIGLNIFEAFRGGESAFVFAQLLRTYKQAFGAEQFEVEPYQFGKNNPEGLQSGAFWFYHRFGFRPVDEALNRLAAEEHQKIMQQKGYRSPLAVLKQFTGSNLIVDFGKTKTAIKPAIISHHVTRCIIEKFQGNRQAAFTHSCMLLEQELGLNFATLHHHEKAGFKKLSLFFTFCFDLKKLTAKDKKILVTLIKTKGGSEFDYILTTGSFDFEKYFTEALRHSNQVN